MYKEVPAWAELKEKVDVIGSLWKINEFDDVGMMDWFPSFHLILQCVDEVLLCEGFVLRKIDFID